MTRGSDLLFTGKCEGKLSCYGTFSGAASRHSRSDYLHHIVAAFAASNGASRCLHFGGIGPTSSKADRFVVSCVRLYPARLLGRCGWSLVSAVVGQVFLTKLYTVFSVKLFTRGTLVVRGASKAGLRVPVRTIGNFSFGNGTVIGSSSCAQVAGAALRDKGRLSVAFATRFRASSPFVLGGPPACKRG